MLPGCTALPAKKASATRKSNQKMGQKKNHATEKRTNKRNTVFKEKKEHRSHLRREKNN